MTELRTEYERIRGQTTALIAGLGAEDCMVQAMADVSPPKWHLAHTTWFFETFVLERALPGYQSPCAAYKGLFNSYYEAVGPRHPRPERGHLSRPTLSEVLDYRRHVDAAMRGVLERPGAAAALIELGLHHEQQHQELLVMDVKYNFSRNPLRPAYRSEALERCGASQAHGFLAFAGGLVHTGATSKAFAFDSERPSHRRFVEPFELGTRLMTNAEMLEFVAAGGYRTASLWLSDGWSWVQEHGVDAPLYWRRDGDGALHEFTAHGEVPLDPHAPVCHVSGYEADAVAAWAGARLPTEFEWELAARARAADASGAASSDAASSDGACLEGSGALSSRSCWHPRGASGSDPQLFGELWQWTRSAYEPYPRFAPEPGAVGEYNGKFMCGQWVLRGSSLATPRGHSRETYRNFFYPHQRWPFTGIRLARSVN